MQEKFNLLDIDELNVVNSIATTRTKETCNNLIDMWREDGLLRGYFGNRCNEIYRRAKVTNNSILELYIYYCFALYEDEVWEQEREAFKDLASYYYIQGRKEAGAKEKAITDTLFYTLLTTPCVNGYTLEDYKGAKALQDTYQVHRQALTQIQQGKKPKVKDMEKLIDKQQNERLKVGDKTSGVIDMISVGIDNQAKVEGIKDAKEDAKVKFIATMDERTTPMCESLNGQVFNVTGRNTFYRYSASKGGQQKYTCDGLVLGLNLPPITDSFHWCRSTIEYLREP